jgi:hypothetical protein
MAFEHRPNSGTLFKNDRKKAENHPDWKGQINVNGELLDIAAWVKDGKKGKFFSLKVSAPREGGYQRRSSDEDIPF